jgi:hypothetical protein
MDSVESQLPRIDSIFIHMGGPQAHVNSRKCQTATAILAKPGFVSFGIENIRPDLCEFGYLEIPNRGSCAHAKAPVLADKILPNSAWRWATSIWPAESASRVVTIPRKLTASDSSNRKNQLSRAKKNCAGDLPRDEHILKNGLNE